MATVYCVMMTEFAGTAAPSFSKGFASREPAVAFANLGNERYDANPSSYATFQVVEMSVTNKWMAKMKARFGEQVTW